MWVIDMVIHLRVQYKEGSRSPFILQVLWPGLFLKWRESNKNEDILWEEVRRIQEINTDLKSKAISLRR